MFTIQMYTKFTLKGGRNRSIIFVNRIKMRLLSQILGYFWLNSESADVLLMYWLAIHLSTWWFQWHHKRDVLQHFLLSYSTHVHLCLSRPHQHEPVKPWTLQPNIKFVNQDNNGSLTWLYKQQIISFAEIVQRCPGTEMNWSTGPFKHFSSYSSNFHNNLPKKRRLWQNSRQITHFLWTDFSQVLDRFVYQCDFPVYLNSLTTFIWAKIAKFKGR